MRERHGQTHDACMVRYVDLMPKWVSHPLFARARSAVAMMDRYSVGQLVYFEGSFEYNARGQTSLA